MQGVRLALAFAVLFVVGVPASAEARGLHPLCFDREPTILGTDAGDQIEGTEGSDVIVGFGGGDYILPNGGNDFVCAGAGGDFVLWSSGADSIRAGTALPHGVAYDTMDGGEHADRIFGGNSLHGEEGPDYLVANEDDWPSALYGGWGKDTCVGERGEDTFYSCEHIKNVKD